MKSLYISKSKSGGKSKYMAVPDPTKPYHPINNPDGYGKPAYYNFLNHQPLEFNSGIPNFNLYSSIQYNPIPNYKNEEMDIYGDPDIDLINKSKSDYFNYLDSPQYLETAKKTWGSDANKYIDKQKQDIQNTPIVPYKNMKFWDQIKVGSNKAHFDNVRKKILNYWGGNNVLIHELSHATDSKELPKDFWVTDYIDKPGYYIQRVDSINPKYNESSVIKDAALMSPEYSKWNELFSTDNSNIDHDERPTEIRAFINTIRQQMASDNFDWNKKSYDEIRKYIDSLYNSGNEEVKETIEMLKNKDKEINDLKIKALQDLAINNKNNNVFKAKNGGLLNKYRTGGIFKDPPVNPTPSPIPSGVNVFATTPNSAYKLSYNPLAPQTLPSSSTNVVKQKLPTKEELAKNQLLKSLENRDKIYATKGPEKDRKLTPREQKILELEMEAQTLGQSIVTTNQFGEPVIKWDPTQPKASGRIEPEYMDPITMAATFGAGAYGLGYGLAASLGIAADNALFNLPSLGRSGLNLGYNAIKKQIIAAELSRMLYFNKPNFQSTKVLKLPKKIDPINRSSVNIKNDISNTVLTQKEYDDFLYRIYLENKALFDDPAISFKSSRPHTYIENDIPGLISSSNTSDELIKESMLFKEKFCAPGSECAKSANDFTSKVFTDITGKPFDVVGNAHNAWHMEDQMTRHGGMKITSNMNEYPKIGDRILMGNGRNRSTYVPGYTADPRVRHAGVYAGHLRTEFGNIPMLFESGKNNPGFLNYIGDTFTGKNTIVEVVRPKQFIGDEFGKSLVDKNIRYAFRDKPSVATYSSNNSNVQSILNQAENVRERIKKVHDLTNDEFDELLNSLIGIGVQETKLNTSLPGSFLAKSKINLQNNLLDMGMTKPIKQTLNFVKNTGNKITASSSALPKYPGAAFIEMEAIKLAEKQGITLSEAVSKVKSQYQPKPLFTPSNVSPSKGMFRQKFQTEEARTSGFGSSIVGDDLSNGLSQMAVNYKKSQELYPDATPRQLIDITTLMWNSPGKAANRELVEFYIFGKNNPSLDKFNFDYVRKINQNKDKYINIKPRLVDLETRITRHGYPEIEYKKGGIFKKKNNNSITPNPLYKSNEDYVYNAWRKSLPENLRNESEGYNLRGAWEGGLEPEYVTDDMAFHLSSRNPNTGEILKSPGHQSYDMAIEGDIRMGYVPMMDIKTGKMYTINNSIDPVAKGPFKNVFAKGGKMIKRADGSYSQRGLWDNIRANKGSGKKPTRAMLEQERKIKNK